VKFPFKIALKITEKTHEFHQRLSSYFCFNFAPVFSF